LNTFSQSDAESVNVEVINEETELPLGSSPFWDVMQRRVVLTDVSGQPISPILKSQAVRGTSVTNYRSTLRNIPQDWRCHLKRSGSLKSNYCHFLGLEFM